MSAHLSESAPVPRTQGIEYFHRKDFSHALACFDQGLAMRPDDRELQNYKARALEQLGRLEESLTCIDRCLEMDPNNGDELRNRALILTKLTRSKEALATLDRVLQLQPDHVDTLIKRAVLLHQLGQRESALESVTRAVALSPSDQCALNTRGMMLDDLDRREEARADFQAALAIDPKYAAAITNLAIVHARGGHYDEALAHYAASLAIDPHQDNAIYNRAVIRLVLGDWRQGFIEFESRWKLFPHEAARLTRLAPQWRGQEDLKGKTVLLHHEQGFGDTLQFSRYAPLVMARGARVVVATPSNLARLMRSLPGSPDIVSEGEPIPKHDYHCPLMSLPLAFGTTTATVPASVPYLRPDLPDVTRWSVRLGARLRPRIGIVWSGRRYPPINQARDMTLEAIRPLLTLPADFYCLHLELADLERTELSSTSKVHWVGNQFTDFADTAALIANLDLIITVDTAMAHLAGALGKPVWLMNRYTTCWRWLLNRSDSPWYPSLRIFRQAALGDWGGVVEQVLQAGRRFVANFPERVSPAAAPALATPAPAKLLEVLQAALDQHHQGQFAQAINLYQRALTLAPNQVDALHYLGVALSQNGENAEALVALSRALREQPRNAAIHNHHGNALAGLGRHQQAIASYDLAISCNLEFADSHYNRGVALSALGQQEPALRSYARAIELKPGYAQAYNNRALIYAAQGHADAALKDYDAALKAQPQFIDAWINQADLLRSLYRYTEALESSRRALMCDPNHSQAHNGHGATLANMGRTTEAMDSYDRALQLNPSLAEAAWNRGLIQL
jgi:tetratricopeptide (TPR) repeat protein